MKKQTAVEWLEQQFNNTFYVAEFGEMGKRFTKIFEQAKAMEREQMEKAVSHGISNADMTNNRGYFDFDKYYNETYGGEQ